MNNQPVFRLNRQALIAALISAAFPIASHAAAGRVEFAMGNVTALSTDGRERPLTKGTEINTGDTIQTSDGRTQVKFTDGGYISLQPNTQFKVDDYAYEGKADGSEKGFFKLVKGSLRAITGAIGHTNKTAYRINTPVATIGIRGTELTGEYNEEGDNKTLKVHVSHGSVFLENEGGDLILFQGQSGIVTGEGNTPGYAEDGPIVGAAGPTGGTPEQGQQEQQQQQEQTNIFMAAEQYNQDGTPCLDASSAGCNSTPSEQYDEYNTLLHGPLSNIPSLAGMNAEGVYVATNNFSATGGVSGASSLGTVTSTLTVNFAYYDAEASIAGHITGGTGTGNTFSGSASYGSLNSGNGSISGFEGGGLNYYNTGGSSVGTGNFNVTNAQLNSADLSKATMNYDFTTPETSSASVTANMQGTAHQSSLPPPGPPL
jgi:FecR-like protein